MTAIPKLLVGLESEFNEAMTSNDVARIARCVADDWILITPERGPINREAIFDAIRSKRLSHATMSKRPTHAHVSADMAWITGRGQNTGTFLGQPISADEYITDIYHLVDGEWRCALTHLTPVLR